MLPLIFKAVQCLSEKAIIQPDCPCCSKISLPGQTFTTQVICCTLMRKRFTAPDTERTSNVVYLRQTIRTDALFITAVASAKSTPGRIHKIYYCIDAETHCRYSPLCSKSKVFTLYACFLRPSLWSVLSAVYWLCYEGDSSVLPATGNATFGASSHNRSSS